MKKLDIDDTQISTTVTDNNGRITFADIMEILGYVIGLVLAIIIVQEIIDKEK